MTEIYVRLLDEGTEAYRPTTAELVGDDLFVILKTPNYETSNEKWEFVPGTQVRGEMRELEGKKVLIAIEKK